MYQLSFRLNLAAPFDSPRLFDSLEIQTNQVTAYLKSPHKARILRHGDILTVYGDEAVYYKQIGESYPELGMDIAEEFTAVAEGQAPTPLISVAQGASGHVTLTVNNHSDYSNPVYTIYYANNSAFTGAEEVETSNATYDFNLGEGVGKYFRVKALPDNLDLSNYSSTKNQIGTISTVPSITLNEDGVAHITGSHSYEWQMSRWNGSSWITLSESASSVTGNQDFDPSDNASPGFVFTASNFYRIRCRRIVTFAGIDYYSSFSSYTYSAYETVPAPATSAANTGTDGEIIWTFTNRSSYPSDITWVFQYDDDSSFASPTEVANELAITTDPGVTNGHCGRFIVSYYGIDSSPTTKSRVGKYSLAVPTLDVSGYPDITAVFASPGDNSSYTASASLYTNGVIVDTVSPLTTFGTDVGFTDDNAQDGQSMRVRYYYSVDYEGSSYTPTNDGVYSSSHNVSIERAATPLYSHGAGTNVGEVVINITNNSDYTDPTYTLEYSANSDFSSSTEIDTSDTEITLTPGEGVGVYFRIFAADDGVFDSLWSATGSDIGKITATPVITFNASGVANVTNGSGKQYVWTIDRWSSSAWNSLSSSATVQAGATNFTPTANASPSFSYVSQNFYRLRCRQKVTFAGTDYYSSYSSYVYSAYSSVPTVQITASAGSSDGDIFWTCNNFSSYPTTGCSLDFQTATTSAFSSPTSTALTQSTITTSPGPTVGQCARIVATCNSVTSSTGTYDSYIGRYSLAAPVLTGDQTPEFYGEFEQPGVNASYTSSAVLSDLTGGITLGTISPLATFDEPVTFGSITGADDGDHIQISDYLYSVAYEGENFTPTNNGIESNTLTYAVTPQVATPTFSPDTGSYDNDQTVTISCATSGATIYYTTNGTNPTTGSTQYTTPITVNGTKTVKAIAVKNTFSDSNIGSATFTLTAATPVLSPTTGGFSTGQSITITSNTTGCDIYYTTNGDTPTSSSTLYSGAISVTVSRNLKAIAIKSGYSNSGVASETYTLTVVAPQISADGGSYTNDQTITLSSSTSGATIYYTINGDVPTTSSTLYSTPFTHGTSGNIKAIAVKTGWTNSSVTTSSAFVYTVATPTFGTNGGSFSNDTTTTILSSTTGVTIYYTVDGNTPTTGSTLYNGSSAAITVSNAGVKALAVKSGYTNSSVGTSNAFTLTVATPTASPDGGSFSNDQTITLSTSTTGATLYYTTNGATPTTGSTLYSGTFSHGTSGTIKILAVKSGYTNSSVGTSSSFVYTVATPTFGTNGGSFSNDTSTTILSSTTGSVAIYYTTDGSTPTTGSTLYNGSSAAITQSSTGVKALAVKSGYTNSSVGTSSAFTLTVATPSASPTGGTSTSYSITLSSSTTSASIYYTLDGSTPDATKTLYSTAINLTVDATYPLKFIAIKTGYTSSSVVTESYIVQSATPAVAPTFGTNGGSFSNDTTTTITSSSGGASIYYTTNGDTPTTSSTLYSGPVAVGASMTIKAIASGGGFTDSTVATSNPFVLTVATPTLSVATGFFTSNQSVTSSCTTTGATIRYTTNGVDPTSGSTAYSGGLAVNSVSTDYNIRVKAFKTGYTDSGVTSNTYTVAAVDTDGTTFINAQAAQGNSMSTARQVLTHRFYIQTKAALTISKVKQCGIWIFGTAARDAIKLAGIQDFTFANTSHGTGGITCNGSSSRINALTINGTNFGQSTIGYGVRMVSGNGNYNGVYSSSVGTSSSVAVRFGSTNATQTTIANTDINGSTTTRLGLMTTNLVSTTANLWHNNTTTNAQTLDGTGTVTGRSDANIVWTWGARNRETNTPDLFAQGVYQGGFHLNGASHVEAAAFATIFNDYCIRMVANP